jgi:hypothetical protein
LCNVYNSLESIAEGEQEVFQTFFRFFSVSRKSDGFDVSWQFEIRYTQMQKKFAEKGDGFCWNQKASKK